MKVEAGDNSMINLSVQQVLSLWAHGTVLRNLTGNGAAAGRGCAGRAGGWPWLRAEGRGGRRVVRVCVCARVCWRASSAVAVGRRSVAGERAPWYTMEGVGVALGVVSLRVKRRGVGGAGVCARTCVCIHPRSPGVHRNVCVCLEGLGVGSVCRGKREGSVCYALRGVVCAPV